MPISPVYSTQFICSNVVVGTPLNVTVPDGFVWVVRSICISTNVSGNTSANLSVPGLAYLFRGVASSTGSSLIAEIHQVLNPGQVLQASVTGGPANFFVSGYQLATQVP